MDMTGKTAFLYHDDYLGYNFGPAHPLKPKRYKDTFELLQRLGIFEEDVKHYEPGQASEEDLKLVHTQEYIQRVKRKCEEGTGYLESEALRRTFPDHGRPFPSGRRRFVPPPRGSTRFSCAHGIPAAGRGRSLSTRGSIRLSCTIRIATATRLECKSQPRQGHPPKPLFDPHGTNTIAEPGVDR